MMLPYVVVALQEYLRHWLPQGKAAGLFFLKNSICSEVLERQVL